MFFSTKFSGTLINIEKQCFVQIHVPEYKLIIFQENGSLFHMRTFIYGDKSEVLSVSRTASQPSLHSSFVLPVMTKKKTFYKEFKKKKKLPAKSNLVKTTATSVILSLVGMQGDCTETPPRLWTRQTWGRIPSPTLLIQAKFGAWQAMVHEVAKSQTRQKRLNTLAQVSKPFRASAFSCHSFIHQIPTGASLLCSTLAKCCHPLGPGAL